MLETSVSEVALCAARNKRRAFFCAVLAWDQIHGVSFAVIDFLPTRLCDSLPSTEPCFAVTRYLRLG